MALLFSSYARWGVRYAALFDRPNIKAAWNASTWAQTDLVERFLDIFIPLADAASPCGVDPGIPTPRARRRLLGYLFLAGSIRGMQRRGSLQLLESLALGAYAWAGEHPLTGAQVVQNVGPGHDPISRLQTSKTSAASSFLTGT